MSRWDDQFESHGVFVALASARQQLEAAGKKKLEDADQAEAYGRLVRVLDYTDARLKACDPELVPLVVLDAPMNSLNTIASYLQQFVADQQPAFLEQANNQADTLLQQLAAFAPQLSVDGEPPDFKSALTSFRQSAGQHLRAVESEVEGVRDKTREMNTQLTEQAAKIDAQDARLDTVVTEYQAQFSTAQEARQTEFSQALEESKTQIRTSIEESEATIKTSGEEAKALLDDTRTASEEALVDAKTKADAQHEELESQGEDRIKQLDALLAKAVKTVGVIGSTGMAGGYQIVANAEQKMANIWRRWTFVALLGAIGATIFAVFHGVVNGFHVDTFFAKWAISVPFAALAGYAAHESSKHREQARINRQIELQLASLDAYLVTLPEEEQHRLRGKLADRFFGELNPAAGETAPE